MSERENIRHAADMLAGYATICRMTNTLVWLEGLKIHLNNYLEAVGSDDRVITFGYGLQTISAAEMADRIKKGIDDDSK